MNTNSCKSYKSLQFQMLSDLEQHYRDFKTNGGKNHLTSNRRMWTTNDTEAAFRRTSMLFTSGIHVLLSSLVHGILWLE